MPPQNFLPLHHPKNLPPHTLFFHPTFQNVLPSHLKIFGHSTTKKCCHPSPQKCCLFYCSTHKTFFRLAPRIILPPHPLEMCHPTKLGTPSANCFAILPISAKKLLPSLHHPKIWHPTDKIF